MGFHFLSSMKGEVMAKKKYLYEVDLMRVVFIFGVLLNHVTSTITNNLSTDSISQNIMNSTHLALHFTRMGFMFMTGLVLTLNYYQRKNNWLTFWKKRYWSVGIPYLAWNAIMLLLADLFSQGSVSIGSLISKWLHYVQYGDHFYMYYLLVTMQLYLLFPLLLKLFKRFEKGNGHLVILITSILIQASLMVGIKYWLPHVDTSSWWYLFSNYGFNIGVYQVYFIAGAYTAIHYAEVEASIMQNYKLICCLALTLALGTILIYQGDINILGLSEDAAHSPHQPYILFYALCMIAFIFWLGRKYAYSRNKGLWPWLDHLIHLGAKLSFGIYLVQTIPIAILAEFLSQMQLSNVTLMILGPILYLLVAALAFIIAWIIYKVPPFGILIGRSNSKDLKKHSTIIKNLNN